ncbi:GGDEF domain-containing protein [Shewanella sp. YIC-542]|uniref:GGDEF domain-containing protein n=1 Tax=Shewanella mytili TaxID=3377111 RepID=UPI00398E41E7
MIYSFSNSGFRDPETGVYNQTYFMEVFHREWYRHLREQQSLALVYLFPLVPGMVNHPHLLDFFAGRVQSSLLRATDILARINQQCFAIGLFNVDETGTHTVIDRVTSQLQAFSAEYQQHHGVALDYHMAACLCRPSADKKPEEMFKQVESSCATGEYKLAADKKIPVTIQ